METPVDHLVDLDDDAIQALIRRLETLESAPLFNDAELRGLREILEHRDDLLRDIRYRRAMRTLRAHWGPIINRYRGFVVTVAAITAAVAATWDHVKEFLQ